MVYQSHWSVAWNWKAQVANRLKKQELQLMQCCITINSFKFPLTC